MRKSISPGLATALICGALSLSALNVAAAAPKFIYTVSSDQTVRSFSVNPTTGALLPLPGGTRIVDEFPFGMAANPEGTLLYSVNPYSNDIAAFKADASSGNLTQALSSPYVTGDIASFLVNPANAELTPVGNIVKAGISATMHIVSNGTFLYGGPRKSLCNLHGPRGA